MPKCRICDTNLDEVRIDGRDLMPRPCSECEEIINDLVQSYEEDVVYTSIESELIEFDEELCMGSGNSCELLEYIG